MRCCSFRNIPSGKGYFFPFLLCMVWNVLERVQNGTFDLILIKPRSVLQLVIVTGFDQRIWETFRRSGFICRRPVPSASCGTTSMAYFCCFVHDFPHCDVWIRSDTAGLGIVWIGIIGCTRFFLNNQLRYVPCSNFSKTASNNYYLGNSGSHARIYSGISFAGKPTETLCMQ